MKTDRTTVRALIHDLRTAPGTSMLETHVSFPTSTAALAVVVLEDALEYIAELERIVRSLGGIPPE